MEALLLPGPSPGLVFMCLSNEPALSFMLGIERGEKPSPQLPGGWDRQKRPATGTVHTGFWGSSGPTVNLRVGLLGLLLPHFAGEETKW